MTDSMNKLPPALASRVRAPDGWGPTGPGRSLYRWLESAFDGAKVGPGAELYAPWQVEQATEFFFGELGHLFRGEPSEDVSPGEIDTDRAVVIGQLAPEVLIALDLRNVPPTVVYQHEAHRDCWATAFGSVGAMLESMDALDDPAPKRCPPFGVYSRDAANAALRSVGIAPFGRWAGERTVRRRLGEPFQSSETRGSGPPISGGPWIAYARDEYNVRFEFSPRRWRIVTVSIVEPC